MQYIMFLMLLYACPFDLAPIALLCCLPGFVPSGFWGGDFAPQKGLGVSCYVGPSEIEGCD